MQAWTAECERIKGMKCWAATEWGGSIYREQPQKNSKERCLRKYHGGAISGCWGPDGVTCASKSTRGASARS